VNELIDDFRQALKDGRDGYIADLRDLCVVQCGSEMLDGVDEVAAMMAERLSALGLTVRRVPAEPYAPHLVAETPAPGPRIVLGGHLDTTYTDYGPLPEFHLDGEYAVGPGTCDMKGGVVVFLAALECLHAAGLLQQLPITVALNTDEERGAPTSRALWDELAPRTKMALFSECAGPDGELVVCRRAKLSYRLDVAGVGTHAGGDGRGKVSALVELSHKIIALEALNGDFAGTHLNVGKAFGGIASNTVPGEATALIDIRYPAGELEVPVRGAVEGIARRCTVPGASATLTETSFRPAWERSDASMALHARVAATAEALCLDAPPEDRGGTADSNWFGARGVPTLDGFGPVGFDDHTPRERAHIGSMMDRALLLAAVLADQITP